MRLLNKLQKFIKLPNKSIFFKGVIYALIIRIVLWIVPFKKVLKLIKTSENKQTNRVIQPEHVKQVVNLLIANVPGMKNCLLSSITFYLLLRDYFPEMQLVIGVDDREAFNAHAWIENVDDVFTDQEKGNFSEIFRT